MSHIPLIPPLLLLLLIGDAGVVGMNPGTSYRARYGFAAVLETNGDVIGWGASYYGLDKAPSGLKDIKNILSTAYAFAALHNNGTVTAWGTSVTGDSSKGGAAPSLRNTKAVYSNEEAFAALHFDSSVTTWGTPTYGGAVPVTEDLVDVKEIFSADSAFAALHQSGRVSAWV